MRIVSLLPSLTELVAALGHQADLVGVTHECDFPPGVERLPHLTQSRIPSSASSSAIDTMVAEQGGSLYDLDGVLLAELRPDLILTQEQCNVCAVNEATVRRVAAGLPETPHVESVNPTCLADLHAMFRRVGDLLGARDAAERLIAEFAATVAEIARRRQGRPPRRVLLLEWFDPPFASGHWNPELIGLAGGVEMIGQPAARSRRLTWQDVAMSDPEIILLTPCGFTLDRSEAELPALLVRPEWSRLSAVQTGGVILVDGSAYFSRPGPRLVASLRLAAAAIDPEACDSLAPIQGWRRLPGMETGH
jgi:iron complex transport system substrate-binding protein